MSKTKIPFYRNPKIRSLFVQIFVLSLVSFLILSIYQTTVSNLIERGIQTSTSFFDDVAPFKIGFSPFLDFDLGKTTYIEVFYIGILNTILIAILGIIASSVERFAVEIRNLQKTEVLEVEENFSSAQRGSSAMPHKRNPVLSENLTGISRYVRSAVIPSLENMVLWHERDISHSSVERILTPNITIATDFILVRLNSILKNLNVYPKNMKKNLNLLRGLYKSQSIMLKLIKKGFHRNLAYKIVQECSMKSWNNNSQFIVNLLENKQLNKVFSKNEIKELTNDKDELKKIDWIFKNKIK